MIRVMLLDAKSLFVNHFLIHYLLGLATRNEASPNFGHIKKHSEWKDWKIYA